MGKQKHEGTWICYKCHTRYNKQVPSCMKCNIKKKEAFKRLKKK